jgi:DNA polymerase III delta prime subunit
MLLFHAILITGGEEQERYQKALDLCRQFNQEANFSANHLINNPDFFLLKPKQLSVGIDQIKALKLKLSRKPFQSPYKIVLILQAEKLTLAAQNALLKLLEEPPSQTLIFLTTASPAALLPTIQSRCQLIRLPAKAAKSFKKEDLDQIAKLLRSLIKKGTGERLLLIQPYLQNRETAIEFCQKAILSLHPDLNQFHHLIKGLQKSLNLLQQNLNPKLVMENLILSWQEENQG